MKNIDQFLKFAESLKLIRKAEITDEKDENIINRHIVSRRRMYFIAGFSLLALVSAYFSISFNYVISLPNAPTLFVLWFGIGFESPISK